MNIIVLWSFYGIAFTLAIDLAVYTNREKSRPESPADRPNIMHIVYNNNKSFSTEADSSLLVYATMFCMY